MFIEEGKVNLKEIRVKNVVGGLGGVIFISFGSSLFLDRVQMDSVEGKQGGFIFIEECNEFVVRDSLFKNSVTKGVSSAIHVKGYQKIVFENATIFNSSTNSIGTFFLKSL